MGFVDTVATYELYQDDGFTKEYQNPKCWSTIEVSKVEGKWEVKSNKKALVLIPNICGVREPIGQRN